MKVVALYEWLTFMHSDENVDQVNDVKGVIDDVPAHWEQIFQLPKDCSSNHKDQVVQDGAINDTQPIVVWILTGIKSQVAFE